MSGGEVLLFFLPVGKSPGLATAQTAEMHFHVAMATAGNAPFGVGNVCFCCVSPLHQVVVITHHGDNV